MLERALESIPDHSTGPSPPTTAAHVKALHGAGMIAHVQEDNVRAEELFAQSLTLARAIGDPHRAALLLNDIAKLALHRGEAAQAAALRADGLALARAADDRAAVTQLLLGLGDVVRAQGDLGYAAACYRESLAIGRVLDDRRRIAWALQRLGRLALERGICSALRTRSQRDWRWRAKSATRRVPPDCSTSRDACCWSSTIWRARPHGWGRAHGSYTCWGLAWASRLTSSFWPP